MKLTHTIWKYRHTTEGRKPYTVNHVGGIGADGEYTLCGMACDVNTERDGMEHVEDVPNGTANCELCIAVVKLVKKIPMGKLSKSPKIYPPPPRLIDLKK